MLTETGIIEKIKPREKTYSVALNKQWFGGFGKCPVQEGDTVTIEYKENGKYKNITKITKNTEQPKPSLSTSTANDIRLQVCVKTAGGVFAGTKATPQEVSSFAKALFQELWGENNANL